MVNFFCSAMKNTVFLQKNNYFCIVIMNYFYAKA